MDVVNACPNVEILGVSNNFLSNDAVTFMTRALTEHPRLRRIDLSKNPISHSSAKSVMQLLAANNRIIHIDLTDTLINNAMIRKIGTKVRQNMTPEEIVQANALERTQQLEAEMTSVKRVGMDESHLRESAKRVEVMSKKQEEVVPEIETPICEDSEQTDQTEQSESNKDKLDCSATADLVRFSMNSAISKDPPAAKTEKSHPIEVIANTKSALKRNNRSSEEHTTPRSHSGHRVVFSEQESSWYAGEKFETFLNPRRVGSDRVEPITWSVDESLDCYQPEAPGGTLLLLSHLAPVSAKLRSVAQLFGPDPEDGIDLVFHCKAAATPPGVFPGLSVLQELVQEVGLV